MIPVSLPLAPGHDGAAANGVAAVRVRNGPRLGDRIPYFTLLCRGYMRPEANVITL
jgi:hypothetical protein